MPGLACKQMFEARRTLEVSIAGMAGEHASGEHLAAMADAVISMFAT
ncbi:MAG: hypothetical protein ACREUZ_08440 [Burkholderiales bacterium]